MEIAVFTSSEVFVSHRNARLTVHGRRLLVRVREQGMPVAHVAKAMGVSRQCAHRWVARYDAEGDAGLWDRSSQPHRMAIKTTPEVEGAVLDARRQHRRGQDWLGPELGMPSQTVSRILRRHDVPRLASCDPLTGEVIRASKTTAVRYERDLPGELVHMDVKKIGRIPDGGGWRAHGRGTANSSAHKRPASGSTTSTPWSMTTAGSPTQRSSLMRGLRPAPASLPAPSTPSQPQASPGSSAS